METIRKELVEKPAEIATLAEPLAGATEVMANISFRTTEAIGSAFLGLFRSPFEDLGLL